MSRTFSVTEAADYVGLSLSFLHKARCYGGGPTFLKLGRRVVYLKDDLDAWLTSRRQIAASPAPVVITPARSVPWDVNNWGDRVTMPLTRDIPVREAPLGVRTQNSLLNGGYATLRAAFAANDSELLRIPNLGRKGLQEVRQLQRVAAISSVA